MSKKDIKLIGIVKFFDNKKGWGIVESKGKSYFIHHSHIMRNNLKNKDGFEPFRSLKENQKVCFESAPPHNPSKQKHKMATNLMVIDNETAHGTR